MSETDLAHLVVAIDGPSGSGKSTVARRVAAALGLRYLDTGAMYRAVTWWALERGVDLADTERVAQLARELRLEQGLDPEIETLSVDGADIAAAIRTSRISAAVSAVATNLGVRAELVARQQAVARAGGVVIEGRDITTVVAPDAPVRVLLTADEQVRLSRRALEVHGSADADAVDATRDQVVRRDADDSTVASFQQAADGVDVVDSSLLSLDETVAAVLKLVEARTGVRA
ncbi:(d)CMP kinase [Jiangella anatolica]|uniref:Cytidylate kinase n=1 Tax=Jiangella anatolica TaxID=2670374 RepID=A0A2W2CA04_9ACTN|nr:(d)CMP kinase [Jiangella anatolica]PZF82616.1 (d)CMP kinase [Jiangella anatolica]